MVENEAPVLYESHCHTTLCGHAFGTPEEYCEVALKRGLKGIIFTCHAPLPQDNSKGIRMVPSEWSRYVSMVGAARLSYEGRLDVRLGLESDYAPGLESYLRELHGRVPLNHVLGSVHYQMGFYRNRFFNGDVFSYQKLYFDHLARAAETGLFDTLAHPDLVKNEAPEEWIWSRIEPYVARSLDRIAKTGVAMELNTSGVLKSLPEMNPSRAQLELMWERNIPVVIGADAHLPARVADGYEEALKLLLSVGYREVSVFLERRRIAIPIEQAMQSLRGAAALERAQKKHAPQQEVRA